MTDAGNDATKVKGDSKAAVKIVPHDPKEKSVGDNTSSIGAKNNAAVHGQDGGTAKTDVGTVGEGAQDLGDKQYVDFEGEVVNKGDNYIDIKYSRNNDEGELDEDYYAVSRFSADEVEDFDKVKKGKGTVRIEHGPLTEQLTKYEDRKVASDEQPAPKE